MNSKQKGSRGERALRDVWKKHGYEDAHRSQQYSGKGESSADIEGIDPRLHIECKVGYNGYSRLYQFLEQSKADAKSGEIPIVNCKMDRKEWLCVMRLDDFIEVWQNQAETVPIIPIDIKGDFHIDDDYKKPPQIIGNVEIVVRCKDCRHRDLFSCPLADNDFQKDEDFCSWGERRNDGKISNT